LTFVSGDSEGRITIWDFRQPKHTATWFDEKDHASDIQLISKRKQFFQEEERDFTSLCFDQIFSKILIFFQNHLFIH
jgi:hypothetical protein